MATFNRPQFLRVAVDSVLSQSFQDFEFIIADDGSGEATRALLRELAQPPIRILWLDHRGKPAAIRNEGLRVSAGRYIAFMDSDDVWLPGKLERQLDSLRSHPECHWGYTACVHIDSRGLATVPANLQPWQPHTGSMLEAVAGSRAHSALPTVLIERELLDRAGWFDEQLDFYEDHDLWLRLARLSEADVVAEPLVQVRRHDEHYSGHDALRTAECRAIFLDRVWQYMRTSPMRREIRRTRSLHAAHLARLRAAAGRRRPARAALSESFEDGWRYPRWWIDAAVSLVPRWPGTP